VKDSQALVLLAAEQSDHYNEAKSLLADSQTLMDLYFKLKDRQPEVAALVHRAGVLIADAIGRIATEKTVMETQ